jgi:hypothetical protein
MDPPAKPSWTDQSTTGFVVPVTVAVNLAVPPGVVEVVDGLTCTRTGGAAGLTVTVAVADFVLSATLVTTTW